MNLTDFWQISDTIRTDFWQIFINQFSDRFLTDIWQIYVNLGTYIDQEYPPFRWIPWTSFTLRPPTSTSRRSSCRRYLKTAKVEVLWFRNHYRWSWSFKWSRSPMVILSFDLDHTFFYLDLILHWHENVKIDAVILIFDLDLVLYLDL